MIIAATASSAVRLCSLIPPTTYSALDIGRGRTRSSRASTSRSCFKLCKSKYRSLAVWYLSSLFLRSALTTIRSSSAGTSDKKRIVVKALRKNKDERYQTAKDLYLDLQ